MSEYHTPVLLEESISALISDPSGIYADVTFGGGGHTAGILSRLNEDGHVIAFDRDGDALMNKIDDKGRVVFPSPFKSLISAEGDARFVVKKDIFEDCLEMYTFEEWERQSEEVKSKLNFFNRAHAAFWREYMRNRAIVEPDAKLGRISIPKKLLESIGVTKEVVFSGNDYKIEIWAKEKYEASEISNEEFLNIAGQLSQER